MRKPKKPHVGLPIPMHLLDDHHAPIIDLLNDTLITSDELATRWRQSPQTMANLRRSRRGVPYIKLPPSGHVRYRLSDIVRAEMGGIRGPITPDVVRMAVSGIPGVSPQLRETIAKRLENLVASEPRG
jgi:hypothetical protein